MKTNISGPKPHYCLFAGLGSFYMFRTEQAAVDWAAKNIRSGQEHWIYPAWFEERQCFDPKTNSFVGSGKVWMHSNYELVQSKETGKISVQRQGYNQKPNLDLMRHPPSTAVFMEDLA